MKVEVAKTGINKLINVPIGLNNLKTIEDLDVDKLKTVPVDLKKISDVVSKEVVKKTKINNFENKIVGVTTLIHIN